MGTKRLFSILVVTLALTLTVLGCGSGGGGVSTSSVVSPSSGSSGGTGGGTATGTASLAWHAPTTNTDGTPLTDLGGFKVHYGRTPGSYTNTVTIGNVTSYSVGNLAPGTYYFTVTAYDTTGLESSYSNEVSKTVL